jgi:hypothetical protein
VGFLKLLVSHVFPNLLPMDEPLSSYELSNRCCLLQAVQFLPTPHALRGNSYVDIRSRANTTRGLDYKHMIKARAHKGGVRIGKTPKKLASICCP